jgi:sarcosine oxidase subunit gamma
MSDAVSALGGVTWSDGIAAVQDIGPVGMITLRGDHSAVRKAATSVTGTDMPGQREASFTGDRGICWMSPDEVLLVGPHDKVAADLTKLKKALGDTHALADDVSDARAVFRLSGPHAREVMAKLSPVDLAPGSFEPGMFRRTRLAQVAAAFRMVDAETFEIVCFRSVAQYVFDLLRTAAQPGSEVGYF